MRDWLEANRNLNAVKGLAVLAVIAATFAGTGRAQPLEGTFNTGVSEVEGTDDASLDLTFHACADDASLTCATIVRIVNPAPDADDILPDGSPVLGFTMIRGLKEKGEGRYRSGKINAVDESLSEGKMKWYGLKIDKRDDGALDARGCLGFICPRLMVWRPVSPPPAD